MTTYVMCPQFGAGVQFFDLNGDPLSGGLLYTYFAGTTTPSSTWTSHLANTFNTNPIVLDSAGRIVEEIWIDLALSYKFILQDANFVQIWEHDYISFYTVPDLDLVVLSNAVDPAKGDALIGYQQSDQFGNLAGAVPKTVHDKLQEVVSVKDFGAVGDGTTDDTDAIILATIPARAVFFPPGEYVVSRPLDFSNMNNVAWIGASAGTSIISAKAGVSFAAALVTVTNVDRWRFSDLTFNWNGNASFGPPDGHGMVWFRETWYLQFVNCVILHNNRGLFLRDCKFGLVDGNVFNMSTPANSENYNLHIADVESDGGSLSEYMTITNNTLTGSGSFFAGKSFIIDGNICANSKFGAGINTWSSETKPYIGHVITNNICRDNIGKDAAGPVRGMEILGQYHQVSGNQCHGNGGPGIAWFGFKSICSNNVCWDNGTEPTGSPGQKAGIFALAGSTTLSRPQESLITGNRCFSAGGYQNYGLVESADIYGMTVSGNDFSGNLVAQTLLEATNTSNIYDIDEWVPYVPTITSTIGALGTIGIVNCEYQQRGLIIFFTIRVTISANGTGSGQLRVSLPKASRSTGVISVLTGRGAANVGLTGFVASGSTECLISTFNGTYPVADGTTISVSGTYAR